VLRVTFGANVWSFVFDFRRPIILLSPRNMPGTHQYAVTLVAQIVAQILGLFWRSLLVDKVSWYMRFFLILPNKYYTFVTSPFLSASPSPAPFCSIFRGPNRLDLWLDLCLKLLFDCHKNEGLLHISFTATFYSLQKFPNTSIRLSSLWSGTMVSQNHKGTYRMTKCHDQSR